MTGIKRKKTVASITSEYTRKYNTVTCRDAKNTLALLTPESAGSVVMDPPYIFPGVAAEPDEDDRPPIDDMIAWATPIAEYTCRALRPGGVSLVHAGPQSLAAWEVAAGRAGLQLMGEIVVLWDTKLIKRKKNPTFPRITSAIRWHVKPGLRYTFNSTERVVPSNVLVCKPLGHESKDDLFATPDKINDRQQPLQLTNYLISLLTIEDDLVVDPFCGSGTALVSAAQLDRRWQGGDSNLAQCDAAELRINRAEWGGLEGGGDLFFWTGKGGYVPVLPIAIRGET